MYLVPSIRLLMHLSSTSRDILQVAIVRASTWGMAATWPSGHLVTWPPGHLAFKQEVQEVQQPAGRDRGGGG